MGIVHDSRQAVSPKSSHLSFNTRWSLKDLSFIIEGQNEALGLTYLSEMNRGPLGINKKFSGVRIYNYYFIYYLIHKNYL